MNLEKVRASQDQAARSVDRGLLMAEELRRELEGEPLAISLRPDTVLRIIELLEKR